MNGTAGPGRQGKGTRGRDWAGALGPALELMHTGVCADACRAHPPSPGPLSPWPPRNPCSRT
jgi:hypothetical protein